MNAYGKTMEVNNAESKSFVLWSDNSPAMSSLTVKGSTVAEMNIWNCWRVQDGTEVESHENSGVIIESSRDATVLKFSDGTGDPDFESLIVEVRVIRREF